MLYIQLTWPKKRAAAPLKVSDRCRRPILQLGLETFQPGAERGHTTAKTRERSNSSLHLRPYRQTPNEFIEFLGRPGAHNHNKPDGSVCRSSCKDLFFILQLRA